MATSAIRPVRARTVDDVATADHEVVHRRNGSSGTVAARE